MKKFLITPVFLIMILALTGIANSQTQSITVSNQTGMKLTAVFVSPAGQDNWGSNISSKDLLANFESFDFTQKIDNNNCTYDFKFRGENGKEYYQQNVSLCSDTKVALQRTDLKPDIKSK